MPPVQTYELDSLSDDDADEGGPAGSSGFGFGCCSADAGEGPGNAEALKWTEAQNRAQRNFQIEETRRAAAAAEKKPLGLCPEGHSLAPDVRTLEDCEMCGVTGTTYSCQEPSHRFDICAVCLSGLQFVMKRGGGGGGGGGGGQGQSAAAADRTEEQKNPPKTGNGVAAELRPPVAASDIQQQNSGAIAAAAASNASSLAGVFLQTEDRSQAADRQMKQLPALPAAVVAAVSKPARQQPLQGGRPPPLPTRAQSVPPFQNECGGDDAEQTQQVLPLHVGLEDESAAVSEHGGFVASASMQEESAAVAEQTGIVVSAAIQDESAAVSEQNGVVGSGPMHTESVAAAEQGEVVAAHHADILSKVDWAVDNASWLKEHLASHFAKVAMSAAAPDANAEAAAATKIQAPVQGESAGTAEQSRAVVPVVPSPMPPLLLPKGPHARRGPPPVPPPMAKPPMPPPPVSNPSKGPPPKRTTGPPAVRSPPHLSTPPTHAPFDVRPPASLAHPSAQALGGRLSVVH